MQEKSRSGEDLAPSISIRSARPEDIPLIKQCLIDSWVEHAKNEPGLLGEERMRSSDIETYYQECFDHPDNHFLFIAEADEKFAGFIRADIKEIPSFFKYPTILYLDDVYVVPEFRRKGIAKSLIQKAEEIAREKGIKRLQGRVYSYNKPVQKLLESMGYTSPHATWDKVLD